ncbi:MAG: peptide chain release factor N(5)-glutamine methyltransferase [Proteobacteria bacterium]|nr:peptide chain release factor N(5)-glutamine methyltransferase [Pseudomonadota bacterium]
MVRDGWTPLNGFLRIDSALSIAAVTLQSGSESPRLDAELLLARALDVPRSYLFAHSDEEMDVAAAERFQNAIDQRAGGVPLAYITGEKEFWSMVLTVSPATLVPRPDTEILVDRALMKIPKDKAMRVLDLGTGSGAIGLAIARERPLCEVVATDVSEDALAIARLNSRELGIPNIEFIQGSWADPVAGQIFDIIVSNPPYVASGDSALATLQHEPRVALVSGDDGLDDIRVIAAETKNVIVNGGYLLLEHGAMQSGEIAKILSANGWANIMLANDLGGLPRVTISSR